MDLHFECKRCDRADEVELSELGAGPVRCGGCGTEVSAERAASLRAAIESLAGELAAVREAGMRLEVVLETDDLPEPHGFDAAYTLPEER